MARAGLEADYSRYLSPLRLFIALFGLQFTVSAIFGTPLTPRLNQLVPNLPPDMMEAWLGGLSMIDVERTLGDWLAPMLWPITVIGSLPYLIALKLYRPSISWWGHVILYLVPANASMALMNLFIPALLLDQANSAGSDASAPIFLSLTGVAMLVYFALQFRMLAVFYSRSIFGAVMRSFGLLLLFPITLIVMTVSQFFAIAWVLDSQFDLSLWELVLLQANTGTSP